MATTVCLVRHGSVVGAETRRFIGHLDVPLSPLGERQMTRLASRLDTVALDAVYASDLLRARRTQDVAELRSSLAGYVHVQPVTQLEISSTDLRASIAAGLDPKFLMPDNVRRIILDTECYAETP